MKLFHFKISIIIFLLNFSLITNASTLPLEYSNASEHTKTSAINSMQKNSLMEKAKPNSTESLDNLVNLKQSNKEASNFPRSIVSLFRKVCSNGKTKYEESQVATDVAQTNPASIDQAKSLGIKQSKPSSMNENEIASLANELTEKDEEETRTSEQAETVKCTFILIEGTVVTCTNRLIIVDSTDSKVNPNYKVFFQKEKYSASTYYWPFDYFNGYKLKHPIYLEKDMEPSEITNILIRSGLYSGTKKEEFAYAEARKCWRNNFLVHPGTENETTVTRDLYEFILDKGTRNELKTDVLTIRRSITRNNKIVDIEWKIPHASTQSEVSRALKQAIVITFPEIRYNEPVRDNEEFTLHLEDGCHLSREKDLIIIDTGSQTHNQVSESHIKRYVRKYTFNYNDTSSTIYTRSKKYDIINELIALGLYLNPTPAENNYYHYSANWCSTFRLIDESEIRHTPYSIIHSKNSKIHEYSEIHFKNIGDIELDHPLHLRPKMLYDQFLTALIETGAINPPLVKKNIYYANHPI